MTEFGDRRKIAFHNLGCKVNSYETEAMLRQMQEQGWEIVPFEPGADVYVINTCTVTNIADRKSRQMLHRAKMMNPDALVVAVGCYAQVAGKNLLKDPAVDLIIGNNEKSRLAERIQQRLQNAQDALFAEEIGRVKEFEELPFGGGGEKTRAFIKIEDGCNQFCSYCLIPYARGRVRSRSPESTLREARRLAEEGYREIVLTGIHMASYGLDFPGDAGGSAAYGEPLAALIEAFAEIEGIRRIRLGSLEPRIITPAFAERLAAVPKLCPHFHLSLQSGSDGVLHRMNRKYTANAFLGEIEALRGAFERPALTTDVIVGFPGETEEEFEETVRFLERAKFYETHVFRYSRRAGTVADRMPDQIPEAVKAKRSAGLLALHAANKAAFERGLIGREREVLLEEPVPEKGEDFWTGFTPEYVRLTVKAPGARQGDLLTVTVGEEML
ncbi:MAG: tRNA (N(6)-L-threonylcarbamoyladenosine(37)-C(2))-methylthiotransferase MtaB [Lachnospiraceae bacterium]|nr:tRNA (N(6)-L-threonylcarbamoyladenosine(37)-C(2))-methylthiotransferase MtaB [Lachnospiraceae bacterium]